MNAKIDIHSVNYASLPEGITNPNDPPPVQAGAPTIDTTAEPVVDPIAPEIEASVQEVVL